MKCFMIIMMIFLYNIIIITTIMCLPILKGDSLQVQCLYRTTGINNVTLVSNYACFISRSLCNIILLIIIKGRWKYTKRDVHIISNVLSSNGSRILFQSNNFQFLFELCPATHWVRIIINFSECSCYYKSFLVHCST